MGVQGDNSSWQGTGAAPMAESEAEPHKRSRRRSGQNTVGLKASLGEYMANNLFNKAFSIYLSRQKNTPTRKSLIFLLVCFWQLRFFCVRLNVSLVLARFDRSRLWSFAPRPLPEGIIPPGLLRFANYFFVFLLSSVISNTSPVDECCIFVCRVSVAVDPFCGSLSLAPISCTSVTS